jgi:glyoxylase I family protein
MIRGIHHVAINTANYDKIINFYRTAFGFEVVAPEFSWRDSPYVDDVVGMEGSAARTVMLKAGTAYLEVFEYFSPPSRVAEPLRPNDRGYTHFAVDTDDIEADYERLKSAGMTFTHKVPDAQDAQGGILRALYGKDPDGNVIELLQLAEDHAFALRRLRMAAE